MITRKQDLVVVDIDDTLVIRKTLQHSDPSSFTALAGPRGLVDVKVHHEHIHIIKEMYNQGLTILCWSAGGAEWAETVVKFVGLEAHVDFVLPKPKFSLDDKEASEWFPKASYKNKALLEQK